MRASSSTKMRCRLYRPVTRKTSERLKIVNLNRRGIRTAPRTNQRWQRQRVSTNMRCRLYSRVARKTSERPKTVNVNRRGIRTANKSAIASQGGYADENATSFLHSRVARKTSERLKTASSNSRGIQTAHRTNEQACWCVDKKCDVRTPQNRKFEPPRKSNGTLHKSAVATQAGVSTRIRCSLYSRVAQTTSDTPKS